MQPLGSLEREREILTVFNVTRAEYISNSTNLDPLLPHPIHTQQVQ